MDEFGFVESVDRLSQGIVVAVAPASHRRFHASLGQPLTVADGNVLRATVGVMHQAVIAL